MDLRTEFRELHRDGCFVMPNPWDRGSALLMEGMGFPALATTSSGHARSIGKRDQELTRDELVAHVADLTAVLSVPLNVDSERLYPDEPGGIVATVRMLAEAGAAGCSIEDYDPSADGIETLEAATAAVAEAAKACSEAGLVLTARAEGHLYGGTDLADTIERLLAFRNAGAAVVYAPGVFAAADLSRLVSEVGAPVNYLDWPQGPAPAELAALGIRRISTGGSPQSDAYQQIKGSLEALSSLNRPL